MTPDPTLGDPTLAAILILGAQRSGTTWLGKIIDSHPDVLYRNEPDIVVRRPTTAAAEVEGLVRRWMHQKDWRTAAKRPFFRKSFQSAPAALARGAIAYVLGAAGRAPVVGPLANRIPIPDFAATARARFAFKSILWCDGAGLFARVLPESRVLFIIRHPCGHVDSVMRGAKQGRFELRGNGADMPYDEAQATAWAATHGVDRQAFLALPDAAKYAWAWRAFNETALAGLQDLPNARVVVYEKLCAEPEALSREILAFVGLNWNHQTAAFLARSTQHEGRPNYYAVFRSSAAAADSWRKSMSDADRHAVEAVVRKSPLTRFWPDLAPP